VDLPIQNGDFPDRYVNIYQRVGGRDSSGDVKTGILPRAAFPNCTCMYFPASPFIQDHSSFQSALGNGPQDLDVLFPA
jgi:hypothetical protein